MAGEVAFGVGGGKGTDANTCLSLLPLAIPALLQQMIYKTRSFLKVFAEDGFAACRNDERKDVRSRRKRVQAFSNNGLEMAEL
jgi:hypothetical protein